jgi:hypothetical protein
MLSGCQHLEKAQYEDHPCALAVSFADARLQRNGRCHETEVFAAFRREVARYRAPEAVSDEQLRGFVRNWAAAATRSSTGYLKGVSVAARAYIYLPCRRRRSCGSSMRPLQLYADLWAEALPSVGCAGNSIWHLSSMEIPPHMRTMGLRTLILSYLSASAPHCALNPMHDS